jgi:KUP system potassium uptake protein
VITPAISILSAVEGSLLIPGLEGTSQGLLVALAGGIAIVLFAFQRKGTEKVARAFGPLMLLWFLALTVSGLLALYHAPVVVRAVNPYHAARFLYENGIAGFFVLSEVILCATGGEALYADMGHLGRRPIIWGWCFVFAALLVNYLGQGAFVIQHPDARNVLFEMVYSQSQYLYVPFLILSIFATIIASQAMISGMFSIVYQGITTRIIPMLKIDYTSAELRSQIYIGSVNWFLLVSVLFVMVEFKESHRLANAYGLAVTGTMTLTGLMMTWIFYLRGKRFKAFLSVLVTLVDIVFFLSCTYKLPHGGYWSIAIASIPMCTILLYTRGQRKLYSSLKFVDFQQFIDDYNRAYRAMGIISGTALFFLRDSKEIPPYIAHTMLANHIVFEHNVFVSVIKRDDPLGVTGYFKEDLAPGLKVFEIQMGYMEVVDLEEILRGAGIEEEVIFYGIEDIASGNLLWRIFSLIKKLAPTFVQFYKLPPHKLHGVVTRIEI